MTAPHILDDASRAERLLDLVAPKLQQVDEEIRRNFRSEIRTIHEVGEHILAGGGKRLRPALLLIASQMLGYEGSRDVLYGAVVEFIHTATLIHDDVIDEADLRRGRDSINHKWGNNLTVLAGDYLFINSMDMALKDGNGSIEILRLLSSVTIKMIEGEILGLETNGRADLTVDDYFGIVHRKTAALFAACCRIPGYLTEVSATHSEALHEYGYNLGICFQLIDDILDFTSSEEVLGKPVLSDVREGKVTLPLILAMPRATEGERALITHVAGSHSFEGIEPADILAIVERYDALNEARSIARGYADRARGALALFPESPARQALEMALDFVMERDR